MSCLNWKVKNSRNNSAGQTSFLFSLQTIEMSIKQLVEGFSESIELFILIWKDGQKLK